MRWSENDELFKAELREGHVWAERVGDAFYATGCVVMVTTLQVRDTIGDASRWASEVDMTVDGFPVEVKSRRLTFGTDPATYPYASAIVDTVDGWEAKKHSPLAVVLVSQVTSAMLVVPTKTRPLWCRRTVWDHVREIHCTNYECPRDRLVRFDTLTDWLRERR